MQLFVMIEMHVVSAARVSSAPVLTGEAGQAGLVWLRSPGSATGDGDLVTFFDAGDTAYLITLFITVEEFHQSNLFRIGHYDAIHHCLFQ